MHFANECSRSTNTNLRKTSLVASMVCVGFDWLCWFCRWLLHHNWPISSLRFEPSTMHSPPPSLTTSDPQNQKIRTHDHALLHHHWHKKVKDSNPRPCTTPPLTPKFKDSNPRSTGPPNVNSNPYGNAPHHHWPPKSQRFDYKTMHYITTNPKKLRFEPTTMHYITIDIQKVKDSNPRPCTTPPLTTKKTKIRTHDHALHHHWPQKSKIQTYKPTTMHYIYTPSFTPRKSKIRTQDHRWSTPPLTQFKPTNVFWLGIV
jgi:hypothetical protein